MRRARVWGALGAGAVVVGVAAFGYARARAVARDLATPRDLHDSAYVGSGACRKCHADHDESWRRTFHRTMTRPATPAWVKGDFGGAEYRYGGVTARMDRDRDGRFRMTFVRAGDPGPPHVATIERTVGSHRYQQYLARQDDVLVRLPIAWHVEERRWFHMNGAFLTPDPAEPGPGAAIAPADYDRHVTRWDDNCIFCHNVAPDPGRSADGRFAAHVAELGIACEACHGPGGEHVRANRDPVRRYALRAGYVDGGDPTIVNPLRLSASLGADMCGRCHGQRIADDAGRFMAHGDPFVPGDNLALYSSPLWRDTTLRDEPEVFAARFWAEGTARLTAYEYQGILQSACSQSDDPARRLTCTRCHSMHTGDPRGQLAPSAVGDGACTRCHAALAEPAALRAHAKHDPAGLGARCVECHMPRIVYGVIDVHRSHRIEVPEPARDARAGRPDACTNCHVDETRAWAVAARTRLWGGPPVDLATLHAPEQGPLDRLFAGDPVERAVAADAVGRAPIAGGAGGVAGAAARRLGALLTAMEVDDYPAVRHVALRAARRLHAASPWAAFDPTGSRAERKAALRRIRNALPEGAAVEMDTARLETLRAEARALAIDIGE